MKTTLLLLLFGIRLASAQLALVSTVSSHGAFNVNVPADIECRGLTRLVFTFNNPVVSVGGASVLSGIAQISGEPSINGAAVTVDFTGVADVQELTVKLVGVRDEPIIDPLHPPPAITSTVAIRLLKGDVTNDGTVNASDIGSVKSVSGQTVGAGNFRNDLNGDGSLSSSDVGLVKSLSGHDLRGSVALHWDPNNPIDLCCYRLHWSDTSGVYRFHLDVGNVTVATVSNLPIGGTYYFTATAVNNASAESDHSNEVAGIGR